ncbi:hypothetical protein [uncultured Maribacter sp.]|uniref:hypothetical protein n=1 Tax=uncultured Maribacter sp. TaxID=431308 RepID=UPI00260F0419|nr:hypothetical protein [uncultured Maribacter sp.]
MKKSITILIIALCLWNCSDSQKAEVLSNHIQILTSENDSLKAIINEVNEKYVFDSIGVRIIPSYKNVPKLNSINRNEIVFIGYNANGNSRVMFNGQDKTDTKFIDTLKMENGAFILERKLTKDYNSFNGKVETENKYGKIFGTMVSIATLAE